METNTHTLKKQLYDTHYEYVRYVALNGLQQELAEEITSQTFEKAIKAIDRGMFKDVNEKAWLSRIAKNTLIDYYRRRSRELPLWVHEDGTDMQIEDICEDDYDEIKENNLKDITNVLHSLSPEQRYVITRHYYDGVSVKDITDELGISINTVLGRLRYGRLNIKRKLRIV